MATKKGGIIDEKENDPGIIVMRYRTCFGGNRRANRITKNRMCKQLTSSILTTLMLNT